jgi:hypothetical protein
VEREFIERRAGRFVPATAVTVALLEENLPIAYGVVSDLSESGACVTTNTSLSPGKAYQFKMSFFGGEILEAAARVVWRRAHRTNGIEPLGIPHGIEFTDMTSTHLESLRRILRSGDFGAKKAH